MKRTPLALLTTLLAAYALTLLVFFPGVMTGDAAALYTEMTRRELSDWQSPVMNVLWRLIDPVAPGPGSMFLLIVTLYWTAFALVALTLARRSPLLGFAVPALALTPPAIVFVGVIWRDILFAAAWLLAAALVFAAQEGQGRGGHRRLAARAAGLALLVFGVLLRQNAIAAAPFLAAYLLWPARFPWRRTALLILPAALLLFVIVQLVYYDLLGAKRLHALHAIMVFDLGGISHFSKQNLFPGPWSPAETALIIDGCYHPTAWDLYWTLEPCSFVMEHLERQGLFASPRIVQAWWHAIAAYPLEYLHHRAAYFLTFLTEAELTLGTPAVVDPASPLLGEQARVFLLVTVPGALAWTPLARGGFWLLLNAALCLLAWPRRGTPSAAFIVGVCGSAVIYTGSFFSVGLAEDFRYHYWALIAALASLPVALQLRGYPNRAPIRNSTFPSGPVIGLRSTPATVHPGSADHHATTASHTAA